ncbi:uncharacterized protein LOC135346102 isoform X2 [Halichondria panicea]|uniref:uncharacterized protein LOC135346102 isoform X2 n=1 Tax=Halichondria panicea TaxID=6063 RepID=UPI00312B688F
MKKKLGNEIWRLRINWTFSAFLLSVLWTSTFLDQMSSNHRFVTNPKQKDLNQTANSNNVEAGLGGSELFYSMVSGSIQFGAVIGSLSMGLLVKYLPYWYLFNASLCALIIGNILYAVSYTAWHLLVAELLIGLYLGSYLTLSYSYSIDSSVEYSQLQQENNKTTHSERESSKMRDLLFGIEGMGHGIGYFIGPGIGVLMSYFNVDQFRSIGWLNAALSLSTLIPFIFLFRGERSRKVKNCQVNCSFKHTCHSNMAMSKLSMLIIISMHLLAYLLAIGWGVFNALLAPVLTDSFGFDINLTAYFILAFTIPKVVGSILLILLQKIGVSVQVVGIIGILITICGYLVMTDWQTIPYDPCTEYSPYHHPELLQNVTAMNYTSRYSTAATSSSLLLQSSIKYNFENNRTQSLSLQLPIQMFERCMQTAHCDCSRDKSKCLTFDIADEHIRNTVQDEIKQLETFNCSIHPYTICLKRPINLETLNVEAQNVQVLTNNQFNTASNVCIEAIIPHHRCHWIPITMLTGKMCADCPPICRSTHQTLTLTQFIVGVSLFMIGYSLAWVTVLAISSNVTPKPLQWMQLMRGCRNDYLSPQ